MEFTAKNPEAEDDDLLDDVDDGGLASPCRHLPHSQSAVVGTFP